MKKQMLVNKLYYRLKPLIPRRAQIWLRSYIALRKRSKYLDVWPILKQDGAPPHDWPGWPENKKFALVLTHDVDTAKGQEKCYDLMKLEKDIGFKSSFNFVPERYRVSSKLRHDLTGNGFEVGVHGLYHDGKLYESRKIFQTRAVKINYYLREWGSVGFRSPAMHHNLKWLHHLNIVYDSSTFDTDPFQPQPDGVETLFPFSIVATASRKRYIELPTTLPQDFVLFILLKEIKIDTWKSKLDWIFKNGGMALLNTHPDYMNFGTEKGGFEEYPVQYYVDFLHYVKKKYGGHYWHALPKEAASFIKNNNSI
jgi:hypothetical protein